MHYLWRLCVWLVLLHRLHASPLHSSTPPAVLEFRSSEQGDHEEVPLNDAGKELNAFRGYDDFDNPKMAPEDDEIGGYFNRIHRRRPPVSRGPRTPVRPERHEKCEDDRDCRRSPSQICIKHAREPSGRCQCPFYRPVEATVNGVVRCVTAKDLFDECRSNEECSATNPYLECINRLCSCPPPHILKDHVDCVGGTSMQDWLSWLIPVSVVAATGVGVALCLISKRKKTGTGSGESDDNDTDNTPGAAEAGAAACRSQPSRVQPQTAQATPGPRCGQYRGEGGTAAAAGGGYQASDVLGRIPPMKEWVRLPRGMKGNNQCTLNGGSATGGGAAERSRVMWAQQAFTTLASPLYQNKLLKRFMAGKGASGSCPGSSTSGAEPHQALTTRRPASPPPQRMSRFCEEPLMSTQLPDPIRRGAYGGAGRRSSHHLQRSPLAATCSDEASSFRSFPVAGRSEKSSQRYAVDEDDAEDEVPPARLRSRSSSRYAAARETRARSESSDALQSPPSRRKVFFANYKK